MILEKVSCDERRKKIEASQKKWKDMQDIPVKLLLSDIGNNNGFFSPLLRSAARLAGNQFALNHAALQLGPYIIDWNTSEIVFPRHRFSSKNSLCLLPVKTLKKSDEVFIKVAEICTDWNLNWKYANPLNDDSKKRGNCQHFIQKILDALGWF